MSDHRKKSNIILIGLPMCGKTTIGAMAAKKLELPFHDCDLLIEDAYSSRTGTHLSCREIHRLIKEDAFRELEHEVIKSLENTTRSLIATGGGVVLDPRNNLLLQSLGTIVYLEVPARVAFERIQYRGMPTYLDPHNAEEGFRKLAAKRAPLYEAISSYTIKAGKLTQEEIIEEVIKNRHG